MNSRETVEGASDVDCSVRGDGWRSDLNLPSAQAQAPAPLEETREEKEAAPLPQVVRGTRDGSPGIPVYEISRLYGHQTQTRGYSLRRNPLLFCIAGAGFEPATFGL